MYKTIHCNTFDPIFSPSILKVFFSLYYSLQRKAFYLKKTVKANPVSHKKIMNLSKFPLFISRATGHHQSTDFILIQKFILILPGQSEETKTTLF